jgi:hypothetical protein
LNLAEKYLRLLAALANPSAMGVAMSSSILRLVISG